MAAYNISTNARIEKKPKKPNMKETYKMLIIRDVFTAKPGQASKLAKVFKKVFKNVPAARVMTDLISDFNTVILEQQVKNLAEYEALMEMYRSGKPGPNIDPNALKEMEGYTEMYITGRREIFQTVD